MAETPTVPLSHPLGTGQWDKGLKSGTASGTGSGTPSLKSLALKVLDRDNGRDKTGTFTVPLDPKKNAVWDTSVPPRNLSEIGLPSAWVRDCDRLHAMPSPASVPPEVWGAFLVDAARFLEQWGAQAAALDWIIEDLLAVHPRAPLTRLGSAGACWVIKGREIVAATEAAIVIRSERGVTMAISKPDLHESAMPWELP